MAEKTPETKNPPLGETAETHDGGGDVIFSILQGRTGGSLCPPHWSKARDKWLSKWWKDNDILKLVISTWVSKATGIRLNWIADGSDLELEQIQKIERFVMAYQSGFYNEFKKFIVDYLTQDNGAFQLVDGESELILGPIDGNTGNRPSLRPGPIKPVNLADGTPIGAFGVRTLESARCERTSDPEWPVIYRHKKDRYLIHCSRIIMMSDLPSPKQELNGVGICSLSRVLSTGQYFQDRARLMGEQMGSLPLQSILYAKEGATSTQLQDFLKNHDQTLRNKSLTKFGQTAVLGPARTGDKLDLGWLKINELPPEDVQAIMFMVAVIAGSFGLTLRDLALAGLMSGQTRADAEVQQLVARGKGIGQFLREYADQFQNLVLPPGVTAVFDNQDDEQDEKKAAIREKQIANAISLSDSGLTDDREARHMLYNDGILTLDQLHRLEALNGRNPEGGAITAEEMNEIFSAGLPPSADDDEGNDENKAHGITGRFDLSHQDPTYTRGIDPNALPHQERFKTTTPPSLDAWNRYMNENGRPPKQYTIGEDGEEE